MNCPQGWRRHGNSSPRRGGAGDCPARARDAPCGPEAPAPRSDVAAVRGSGSIDAEVAACAMDMLDVSASPFSPLYLRRPLGRVPQEGSSLSQIAAISGFIAIKTMIRIVSKQKLIYFSVYT